MNESQLKTLSNLIKENNIPFYQDLGFWISTVIGILGIYFSIVAFIEAREAKKAAKAAGNVVRIQTVTIDLTEIIQRIDKISTESSYSNARDFYSEINRRIRRIISVISLDSKYKEKTDQILLTLSTIKTNLDGVRQNDDDEAKQAGISVFYAIEGEFSNLAGLLADLSGLLEQRTLIN